MIVSMEMERVQESTRSVGSNSGMSTSAFRLEDLSARTGAKIWTLTFDLPGEKVNKLGRKVLEEFDGLLNQLAELGKSGAIEALVLVSGKPGNFIAGADIEMFQQVKTAEDGKELSRTGQKLMSRFEDLPFPTVAAISGVALGGGFEFALTCSAIVMSNDPATKIGLPEVQLGIIPGMGGCVRLPRKVGLATALDLILSSKNLNGERAYKAGVIEAVIPKENFEESALQWVKKNLKALTSGTRLAKEPKLGGMGGAMGSAMEKTALGRAVILKKAREGVISKTKGHYPAPLEAIAVISETGAAYGPRLRGDRRERAMEREAQGFGKMAVTDVSRNLVRLFFMTEAVKKSKGLPPGVSAQVKKVRTGAVLGAGVMGGGIAQLFAEKSIPIRMKDLNTQGLTAGMEQASRIFKSQVKKRRINARQYLQKLNYISPVADYSGFHSTDLVIEAIVEKMDVKKKVLAEVESFISEDCVVASNTSSLSITEMASAMKKPERFGGMHFFNPVSRMPLIEVIRGEKSSDETITTIFEFCKRLGKTPIVVKDAPGFLVNRLLMPCLNEATWLLADGVPIPEIDRALSNFGLPMGGLELIDEVGIDTGEKVAHILHDAFGERMLPAPFNDKATKSGRLGKKNGKGFYIYDPKTRQKSLDPKIYEILGVTPKSGAVSDEEIVERCILPMINEAARCLEEGIVATASEVDLGMIMGTGFPPFRGGLLRYADSLGARAIVEKLKKYQPRLGARFEPSPALVKMAEHGTSFYPS
jgi:3-hydroxyacyl-CoA dehydrogenase/enoyl-CoA hydratase/3-hydroxybutyryl-CoA epimerase